MYLTIILAFGLGLGLGVSLEKIKQSGRVEQVPTQKNPFLDEADSEEADELRAEGAQSVQDRIERRKVKIMEQAKREGRITNDGVEDLFCISDRTASKYLRALTTTAQLTRRGAGRGTYYVPVE